MKLAQAIDSKGVDGLGFDKKEVNDAGILCQASCQKGNERSQSNNHEKWTAGNSGCMLHIWYEDFQDRKELGPMID